MLDRPQPIIETTPDARDWVKVLSAYREPSTARSFAELAVTLGPFIALWALAWWALDVSVWLSVGLATLNAGFCYACSAFSTIVGTAHSFTPKRSAIGWAGPSGC